MRGSHKIRKLITLMSSFRLDKMSFKSAFVSVEIARVSSSHSEQFPCALNSGYRTTFELAMKFSALYGGAGNRS